MTRSLAWPHNISEFVVRIDEALAANAEIAPEDTRGAISLARKIFSATETGDGFQKKYFDAIVYKDPAVVMEHATPQEAFGRIKARLSATNSAGATPLNSIFIRPRGPSNSTTALATLPGRGVINSINVGARGRSCVASDH